MHSARPLAYPAQTHVMDNPSDLMPLLRTLDAFSLSLSLQRPSSCRRLKSWCTSCTSSLQAASLRMLCISCSGVGGAWAC